MNSIVVLSDGSFYIDWVLIFLVYLLIVAVMAATISRYNIKINDTKMKDFEDSLYFKQSYLLCTC